MILYYVHTLRVKRKRSETLVWVFLLVRYLWRRRISDIRIYTRRWRDVGYKYIVVIEFREHEGATKGVMGRYIYGCQLSDIKPILILDYRKPCL